MKHFENLSLEDIEGEIWVPFFGNENYEVSNLGRLKSLDRFIVNRWGSETFIKGKIIKQSFNKVGGTIVLTAYAGKSISMQSNIFFSFYPELHGDKSKCVAHINKDTLDNRIDNLVLTTWKKSKLLDMLESDKAIKSTYKNFTKLKEQHDLILIKKQTSTTKQCSKCNEVKLKNKFQKGIRVCNNCRYKQQRILFKSKQVIK
jgi:ribosomal protein L37AE/L43A